MIISLTSFLRFKIRKEFGIFIGLKTCFILCLSSSRLLTNSKLLLLADQFIWDPQRLSLIQFNRQQTTLSHLACSSHLFIEVVMPEHGTPATRAQDLFFNKSAQVPSGTSFSSFQAEHSSAFLDLLSYYER